MTALADVRADLAAALEAIDAATVYRHPRLSYDSPALIVTATSLDFRAAMGTSRTFGFGVIIAVRLTDDDSSGDLLDELTEAVAVALVDEGGWDVQPAADIEAVLANDSTTFIQRLVPVAVFE